MYYDPKTKTYYRSKSDIPKKVTVVKRTPSPGTGVVYSGGQKYIVGAQYVPQKPQPATAGPEDVYTDPRTGAKYSIAREKQAAYEAEQRAKMGPIGQQKHIRIPKQVSVTRREAYQESETDTGKTIPYVEQDQRAMMVPEKSREQREAEGREAMRYMEPESPFEMVFAPAREKTYYEEKYDMFSGPLVEFTSASLPVFTSMFDPRTFITPKKEIDISSMGWPLTVQMGYGLEYAGKEPIKVAGMGAGIAAGAIVWGKLSSYIGGKLPGAKKEYKVTYWKGTLKTERTEMLRAPKYEYVIEKIKKPEAGLRVLDMNTVQQMTKYEKMLDFRAWGDSTTGLGFGRKVKSLLVTKTVATKPDIPEFVLTLEARKGFSSLGFGSKDTLSMIGGRDVSARIPVEFARGDFKVTKFVGKPSGKAGPIWGWEHAYPEMKPDTFTFDFYAGLVKSQPIKPLPPGYGGTKVLTEVGLRTPSRAPLGWSPVPIGVEELSYPAMLPPGFSLNLGRGLGTSQPDMRIFTTKAERKPISAETIIPKESFGLNIRPESMLGTRMRQSPLRATSQDILSLPKVSSVLGTAVVPRERQLERQLLMQGKEQVLKSDMRLRIPRTPFVPRGFGMGRPLPTFPPMLPGSKRRRRKGKRPSYKRKYRYTPSLLGALGIIPKIGKPPKLLTGLGPRAMLKRKRKKRR